MPSNHISDGLPQPPVGVSRDDTPLPLYVGNANDPATVLADADAYYAMWFSGSDDDEVAIINAAFNPFPIPAAPGMPPTPVTPPFWLMGSRAAALVQMYDLINPLDPERAGCYLERLRRIAYAFLENRDDRREFPPQIAVFFPPDGHPVDAFRGRVMATWGSFTTNRDGKWNTDVSTSALFVYAMAAFARRVTDDLALQARYGGDAVRLTSATLDTYAAFAPELHFTNSDTEAWYTVPQAYADLACNGNPPGCEGYQSTAGEPIAYNENLSMMKALAEVSLAGTSALYLKSADANAWTNRLTGYDAPLLIAKNCTFFENHLSAQTFDGAPYFTWNTQPENTQSGNPVAEDTAHGGLEMGCLAVILDTKTRLNALLAAAGRSEQIPLSTQLFVGFANTFLFKIWHYDYQDASGPRNSIDHEVAGTGHPTADNNDNKECAGWTSLAQFDPWIWRRCRDATFNPSGYYLHEDNHAALLRYRQFA